MLARVQASAVMGIDAYRITVEVDVTHVIPMFTIVGLPDVDALRYPNIGRDI